MHYVRLASTEYVHWFKCFSLNSGEYIGFPGSCIAPCLKFICCCLWWWQNQVWQLLY